MHIKKMFDLENERQGRGVQVPFDGNDGKYQNLAKSYDAFCVIALTVFEILMFQMCDLDFQGHTFCDLFD